MTPFELMLCKCVIVKTIVISMCVVLNVCCSQCVLFSMCVVLNVCCSQFSMCVVTCVLQEDDEYIGFATLPEQVHRKAVRKGFDFTLMVVGKYLDVSPHCSHPDLFHLVLTAIKFPFSLFSSLSHRCQLGQLGLLALQY